MSDHHEELLKKIWIYKTYCIYDLSHPNEESKSALYMEEVLREIGISPKKNLGHEFFLGVRIFTDVQFGFTSPMKALTKLLSLHY